MFDAIKPLLDAGIVNEDTQQAINEAWETKLNEARESIRAELREEFAQRYEHDKSVMVEALDTMVTDALSEEIKEFQDEKQALAEDRVKFTKHMTESAGKFDQFMIKKLSEEIQELRADKRAMAENYAKLEEFVVEALSNEIAEFYEDKKDLAETKVRLVREAKEHFAKVKRDFIERSAKAVSETVAKGLKSEISALKEDIDTARRNDFGRKIFEAFAAEYGVSYLNEKSETAKLLKVLETKDKQLSEARAFAAKAKQLAESKAAEKQKLEESVNRSNTIRELIAPLSNEQREIMTDLLESVQTSRLQSAFEKYLPAVIDGKGPAKQKAVLAEAKAVTGNRETVSQTNVSSKADDNVIDIKRLAGLN
jgi:hypothetical protein